MDRTLNGLSGYQVNNRSPALSPSVWPFTVALLPAIGKLMCTPIALLVCKVVIVIVSGYDVFLTIKYVETLPMMEMNPMGRWLMNLNGNINHGCATEATLPQTAWFITAKFLGNVVAFSVIEALARWRMRTAVTVATALAFFQLCLLAYLLFANG